MTDDSRINSSLRKNPVAIIGMGSLFPDATNLQEYWDNIVKEVDSITEVPPSRWSSDDYFDPDPSVPDKTYNNRGGFLPDIDFNPMEFGLPPNILEVTDASQLLSLVVATQALRDAGYGNGREFNRARTGVTMGVGGGQKLITPLTSRLQYPIWDRVLESSGIEEGDRDIIVEKMKKAYIHWEENSFPGMLGNVISGRVANRLDLGGMNCVVDAACAASLAAIKMAVLELADGRADMMLSGGVDTDNSIFMYMSFSKTPAFSRKQVIRPFDAESDGMMIGEGVGIIVMKRLADAERDGDRIYAVIRGVGASSDGRYKSIYAPRATGQAQAVVRAYDDAGYSHATIGLVEAHGTGTPAGDPTEFDGLNQVFSHNNPARQHIALGSVKSQIGHTKAAAGAASMIKVALALHHKILPPTLNVTEPNPKMDIENTPFYLNTHTRPWLKPTDGSPRRAGVSAFGFGGTNFHFALEEYNTDHAEAYRLHKTANALFLAAPSPQQLLAEATEQLTALQSDEGLAAYETLIASSQTPNIPIASARIGFVSESLGEAAAMLETAVKLLRAKPNATDWEHPKGIYYRQTGIATQGKVVALFPGQGSQYLEMGKRLALNFPAIRDAYGQIDALFAADGQRPLSSVVFPVPGFSDEDTQAQNNTLRRTENVQPAIGAFSFGLYKLLQQAGFSPDFAAGHSFGELTALWAGGVLNDTAFTFLTKARGQAMAAPSNSNFDAGTMLAVQGDTAQLQRDVQGMDGVRIANFNSNEQVVLAGSRDAMATVHKQLEPMGYVVTPLPVSAAFHTSFVGHAQRPFSQAIDRVQFAPPRIPVYGNSSGQPYANNPAAIQASLKEHILNPVLFRQEIENIYAAGGAIFVEIGPKRVLTNLVKNILNGRPHVAIAVNASSKKDSDRQLREAYAQLCVAGLPLRALDPYPVEYDGRTANKHTPVNVTLGGHNYVSPKTKKAFEDALNDGHRVGVASGESQVASKQVASAPPVPVAPPKVEPVKVEKPISPAPPPPRSPAPPIEQKIMTKAVVENGRSTVVTRREGISMSDTSPFQERLEKSLAMLHEHQADTARAHEMYLQGQAAYAQSVVALMQGYQQLTANGQQLTINGSRTAIAAPAPAAPVAPAPEPIAPVAPPPVVAAVPVVATPAPQPQATAPVTVAPAAVSGLAEAMLVIVSEKTGYPVEMLELDMDMEADLGIDSIKRVEILGAMQEQHPELPEVNPNELAELRTLQEIVDHMGGAEAVAPAIAELQSMAPAPQAAAPVAPAPVVAAPVAATSDLSDAMLVIVSEKTGYPVEMLELDMDMEADLGIDSIKRVEILGAMQEQHPELPEVNPNELAELRTLREIVEHMGAAGNSQQPTANSQQPTVVAQEPIAQVAVAQAVSTPPAATSDLSDAMLVIVSEKTGYPVEMLELDMDMEADLGIDSIKRVEILGAMQEQHPELPEVNPNELAELRTLREIVEHMGAAGNSQQPTANSQQPTVVAQEPIAQVAVAQAVSTPPAATSDLSDAMLVIVSEKTGYPVEMLELDMDMEADLGIDSIKRVEILGAMQEQHPELPEVNPNELAELRTLREIVEHMQGAGAGTPAVAQAPIAQVAVAQTAVSTPPTATSDLSDAMLVIVSEKTGYPVEMLELDMDMEADLGIDSIKRVEILGAMQEQHPELPEVNPNELAELRTLREIVEHMQGAGGQQLTINNEQLTTNAPQSAPTVEPQISQSPISQSPVTSDLSDAMLVIVSEKTGYPVEMLELDMDMEADLGIDSIKRVEILGAMQEQHPELPEVNPNELAELRTLREIVEHMQGAGAGTEKKADPAVAGAGFSTQGNSVPAPSNHAITRNVVHVKSLPMPDFLAFSPSQTAVCLLTDDGTALTTNVASALLGRGWKVAVLSFPQSLVAGRATLPSGVQQVALDSLDEAELQSKLGAFNAPIGSFIHLNPVVRNGAAKGIVKTVFFIAKHLKEALNGADERAAFMTVAQLDGALGMDGGLLFNPINGGLFGLTKTMNLEWPNVYCRAVDLHPGIAAEQAAGYVLAELYDPNRLLVEVGYGNKGRVTLETAVSPLDPYTPSAKITPSSVFVVSGGAKGITAQCAINLAEQYQCKFILLGRSSIADVDTSWVGEYANEAELKRLIMNRLVATGEKPTPMAVNKIARSISSKHEIEGTLNAIAQTGGQAEYVSVDVTDGAGLKRELTAVSQRLGQITGLIHGAGVLSDKLIEKKTDGDFEAVYSTKVHGLHALLQAIPPAQLSHLALFSSAAGFYGNVGQADYALANDILNKTAHLVKRQYPACHVVSIDWGPWDGGMVTPALKQLFAERNIAVIPVDVGAWILANELTEANAGVVQTVVGGELAFADAEVDGALQTHRLHRFLSVAANPFLRDHVIGGSPVLPTVCAIAWMSNACEQLYPGFTMASCDKYQVLKGIVFDDANDAPQEYVLDLEETAKGDGSIAFKAIVSSKNAAGKPRYHYRAEITLMATLPDAPIYANVDLSEQNPMDKATLYSNGTLFHGADFQGVERVLNISPTKVTMRCHLPAQPDGEAGQFGVQSFNPFIADGQFQSMVIWARHFHDAGSLPLFTERGEQFRPIPFGETTYVSMEVKESSSSKLVADIITHGENGRVYARVLGAQVTISEQLNHLFVPSE